MCCIFFAKENPFSTKVDILCEYLYIIIAVMLFAEIQVYFISLCVYNLKINKQSIKDI